MYKHWMATKITHSLKRSPSPVPMLKIKSCWWLLPCAISKWEILCGLSTPLKNQNKISLNALTYSVNSVHATCQSLPADMSSWHVTCEIKNSVSKCSTVPLSLHQSNILVTFLTTELWLTFCVWKKNEDNEVFNACCCSCWALIVSGGLAWSMWSAMHSQVCEEAQWGTGTGFINKPNKGWCRQWPLRCSFGRAGMADVYPEETNKALSVSWEVSQPRAASLERSSVLIMSLRGDDHTAPHNQPRPPRNTRSRANSPRLCKQQLCSACNL